MARGEIVLAQFLITTLPIVLTVVGCGLALLKGDAAEKQGATIMFVAWISENFVMMQKLAHGTTNLLFAIDVVLLLALCGVAWTCRRAWAVLASMAQAMAVLIHIMREMGVRIDGLTYFITLSIAGYGQLLALIIGTVIAWRERAALASFGIVAQPDDSSPASARSIRPSVFSTPKMATKDPNRGPWF
jgi:hypothetical protein